MFGNKRKIRVNAFTPRIIDVSPRPQQEEPVGELVNEFDEVVRIIPKKKRQALPGMKLLKKISAERKLAKLMAASGNPDARDRPKKIVPTYDSDTDSDIEDM